MEMKNLIANFLMVVTLLTGSAIFASAQKPTSMETDSAIGAEVGKLVSKVVYGFGQYNPLS